MMSPKRLIVMNVMNCLEQYMYILRSVEWRMDKYIMITLRIYICYKVYMYILS